MRGALNTLKLLLYLTGNFSIGQRLLQSITVKGKEQKHCFSLPVGLAACGNEQGTAYRQASPETFSRPGDVPAVVKEGPDAFSFSSGSLC